MLQRFALFGFAAALLISCGGPSGPAFQVDSEQVAPGETLSLTYNPSDTPLEKAQSVTAYAAVFGAGDFRLVEIPTQKSRGVFTFDYAVPSDATGLLFWFRDQDGMADMNESRGYTVPIPDASGEVPASYALDLASVYKNIDLFLGIEVSPDTIVTWVDNAVAAHPELLLPHFDVVASTTSGRAASDERKTKVDSLFKSTVASATLADLPQKTLENLRQYASMRKDAGGLKAEFDALDAALRASYPKSTAFISEEFRKYSTSRKPSDWLAGADSLAAKFEAEDVEGYMANLYSRYISSLGSRKSYDSLFAGTQSFKYWDGMLYTNLANALADTMPEEALKWADKNIAFAQNRIDDPKPNASSKSDPYTSKQGLKSSLAFAYSTKAKVLLAAGDTLAAADLLGQAVTLTDSPSSAITNPYATSMFSAGRGEDAFKTLEKFVVASTNTAVTDSIMKRVYLESGMGSEEAYAALREDLKIKADEYLVDKTRGKMMDRLAPNFELRDTEGNLVRLSDYRGKAVVVDFWATWCGPCIASFPDMKKAMATLNADQVHFLYVHTWDPQDDKTRAEAAKAFMDEKGYEDFHTLIDEDDQVCSVDYMVRGIPTKFIVGADGRIKFKSIGFNSNAEYMTRELRSMIALALDAEAEEPVPIATENTLLKIESTEAPESR